MAGHAPFGCFVFPVGAHARAQSTPELSCCNAAQALSFLASAATGTCVVAFLALIRTRVEEVAALAHAPLNICAHHLHLEVVLNIALDAKRRIVLAPQTIFIAEQTQLLSVDF